MSAVLALDALAVVAMLTTYAMAATGRGRIGRWVRYR